jgi:serine protease AprX
MVLGDHLRGSLLGRDLPERGWSLDFSRGAGVAAGLTAMLVLSALTPASALADGHDPAGYDPAADMNSMYNTTAYTGVTTWWDAGYTGQGVDVAIIDTGVSPVEGLATPDKIVYGPDLSLESQAPNLTNLDANGHGTFMAGIIAGRGSDAEPGTYATDRTDFLGVAPDARIVSVKVGNADGATDVSQVIAAIDWVVQHRTDNGLNIRVLNLSYGTNSTQSYTHDPLAYAVERAWRAGIFVVTAAGNAGYVARTGSLTDPASDPKIFAVGASDSRNTATTDDDRVPSFSSTGNIFRSPDLVAPGTHIVSLRVPGSFIDETHGNTGRVTDTLFRGSGTSEAAAFVAGAAALVIQQRPEIKPDELKKLFLMNAISLDGLAGRKQGHGEVSLTSMLTAGTPTPPALWRAIPWSDGSGSLEASRGTEHLAADGVALSGEQDIFGAPFDSDAMAKLEANGRSWSGGTWNGNSWSGNSWSGSSWSGNSWSGNSWSGNSWSGNSWSGSSWSGSSWSGSSWSGNSWSGNSWSGSSWS